jgi:hypothetical protein
MGKARGLLIGCCALALLMGAAGAAGKAAAKPGATCALPAEMAAMRVSAIQQELMDAALTCGAQAKSDFNAFQTAFGLDLRKSDKLMQTMFRRVNGKKGDAAYNLFKTDLASKAEFRRIQHSPNFCAAAARKAALALSEDTINVQYFAEDAAVTDFVWPVHDCGLPVASPPAPDIMPLPNPLRVAALTQEAPVPPAGAAPATATPPATPDAAPGAATAAPAQPQEPAK